MRGAFEKLFSIPALENFRPVGSRESSINDPCVSAGSNILLPGSVRGKNNTTGIGLVEIYNLP
jgi:hypothetical protein